MQRHNNLNRDEKGQPVTPGCIVVLDGPAVGEVISVDRGAAIVQRLWDSPGEEPAEEREGWQCRELLVIKPALLAVEEFPLELFKDLIRWYLRENLGRKTLDQFMRSTGHQYIGITIMDRQDGGEDLPVIEWTLADEIGINDDDGDDDDEPSDSPAPEPAESAV